MALVNVEIYDGMAPASGSKVTLGQIARLADGFEDTDLTARFQGKPAATLHRLHFKNNMTVLAMTTSLSYKSAFTLYW